MSNPAEKNDDEIVTDDIDADMRAALSELKTAGVVEDAPEAKVTLDQPKEDKTRDETGKFAKAEETKTEKPQRQTLTLPEKTDAAKADLQPAAPGAAAAPVASAPAAWSPPMKEQFGKLPTEVQSYINAREIEAFQAISAKGNELKLYKDVREVAQPYMATMYAEGTDPAKAFGAFLNTAHVMRTGDDNRKASEIAKVMQAFKVSPQALFSILQGGSVQTGSLPIHQASAVQPDQIAGIVQAELTKQRQIQDEADLQRQIREFGKNPAYKFFDLLKPKMSELLLQEENGAIDLIDAYEKALDLYPDIRSIASGQQPAPVEQNRITQIQAKTDAAKRAAGSVTGAPGGGKVLNGAGSVGSIEDDLRAAIREHSGRM